MALPHGQDLAHGNQHQSSPSVLTSMETTSQLAAVLFLNQPYQRGMEKLTSLVNASGLKTLNYERVALALTNKENIQFKLSSRLIITFELFKIVQFTEHCV